MSFIYLASPYSHKDPFIREERYLRAMKAMAHLLSNNVWVYAPIVHCHELAKVADLPKHHEFWQAYDFAMIDKCEHVLVLRIDGWNTSLGVKAEIEYAKSLGKDVRYI